MTTVFKHEGKGPAPAVVSMPSQADSVRDVTWNKSHAPAAITLGPSTRVDVEFDAPRPDTDYYNDWFDLDEEGVQRAFTGEWVTRVNVRPDQKDEVFASAVMEIGASFLHMRVGEYLEYRWTDMVDAVGELTDFGERVFVDHLVAESRARAVRLDEHMFGEAYRLFRKLVGQRVVYGGASSFSGAGPLPFAADVERRGGDEVARVE